MKNGDEVAIFWDYGESKIPLSAAISNNLPKKIQKIVPPLQIPRATPL